MNQAYDTLGYVPDPRSMADAPSENHTVLVYAWDFTEFTLRGSLTENSTPGAGHYVLALRDDTKGTVGLPSSFLELTS